MRCSQRWFCGVCIAAHQSHRCHRLPCSGSSGSPLDSGLPCSPGGSSDPVKIRLSVRPSAVNCPPRTARFSPAHSEKEKRQADVWERYAVLCPLVGLTLLQCKLRTSLTAQFCVWFLLLCWCGAELWQPGRRWTCPTPALHLYYTCTVCHVGWRGRGCDTVVEKQPLLGWMCPLTSQQHDELSN